MDRLDVAATLIDASEAAVESDIPVRTRGSGDHTAPVILITPPSASPRIAGNTKQAGTYTDETGTQAGVLLEDVFDGSATIEVRSQDEEESYNLAKAIHRHLAKFEEYPTAFHADMNELSRGRITEGGFQTPLPEPVYKHQFTVSLDYTDTTRIPFDEHTGVPLESIHDNINTS